MLFYHAHYRKTEECSSYPLLELELVTVCVMVSPSLLVLTAEGRVHLIQLFHYNWLVIIYMNTSTKCWLNEDFPVTVFLNVCCTVGLFVFFTSTVTFVEGDPMPDMSALILWENNQNSPAPIPERKLTIIYIYVYNQLLSMSISNSIFLNSNSYRRIYNYTLESVNPFPFLCKTFVHQHLNQLFRYRSLYLYRQDCCCKEYFHSDYISYLHWVPISKVNR